MSEQVPPCRVCGSNKDILVYPDDHALAVCPSCCPRVEQPDGETGHYFEYFRGERQHACRYCGIPRNCTDWQDDLSLT